MEKLLIGQLSILGLLYMAELLETRPQAGSIVLTLVGATWLTLAIKTAWDRRK